MNRVIWVLAAAASCLWAHGGVLLLHQQSGPYLVSLFSADAPLRAGAQDFTVLVQEGIDSSPVIDGHVVILLQPAIGAEVRIEARAGQAANKLLYAAPAQLTAGVWKVTISIQAAAEAVPVHGTLTILPEQAPIAAYWPYFAIPPVVVGLFILNRWLKRRSKTATIRSVRASR